jgi:hypothetical protein
MTQVAILSYKNRKITAFDSKVPGLDDALAVANLERGKVDFGTVRGIHADFGIIVYEYGLMEGQPDAYFRISRQLFNGNAVLYLSGENGETIDLPILVINHLNSCTEVEFFDSIEAVEAAISAGRVRRPSSTVNGQVFWEWNR